MNVTVNSKELGAALKVHAKVGRTKKKFQEVLRGVVLMSAADGQLTVTSTDLTMFLTTHHDCNIDGATVPVLVDVATLRKALAAIKDGAVLEFPEMATEGSVLTVRGAGVDYRIPSIDPVCFPALPVVGATVAAFTFTADGYAKIIGKVAPSMDRNIYQRLEFQGVCFRQREHLEVMATDSRCLVRVTLVGDPSTPGDWIIPAAAIDCFTPSDSVLVEFDADQCRLASGNTEIVTLLVGAEFPDVDCIIPATTAHTVSIDREQLRAALVNLGAKPGPGDLVVTTTFDADGALHLATADNSAATVVHYDGDAGGVHPAFFAGYFLDGVVACDPVVTMGFDNDTQPVLLSGNSFLYLVMPHHGMKD